MTAPRAGSSLPDARDRRRAATLFDRNLVVTAGAGTGKTALLVQRALNLIAGAGIPVGAIAAITFTEKAAAELRERLALGLDELRGLAARGARPEEADQGTEAGRAYAWLRGEERIEPAVIRERALAALLELDVASVTTIHAFCSEILRRHPREAGVDPDFTVDEGPAFDALLDETWDRFLQEELGGRAPRAGLWRRALLQPGALEAVRSLARALASFGVPGEAVSGPPGARYAPADPEDLFGGIVTAARDAALDMVRRYPDMNRNMSDFLSASVELLDEFLTGGPAGLHAYEGAYPLDAYCDWVSRGLPNPGARLEEADAAEVTRAARAAASLIRAFRLVDEQVIASLVEAAAPAAARAREALLSRGVATFDALLRLARDLLAAHPEARRDLARRYTTLLVDEFQDTDPLQYEILFFIAEAEGSQAADAYATRLAPGRLFIVGDPKQSIYRFRGADMEAYQRAVEHVLAEGGERLALTASFRSPSEIVDPINDLFRGWIGPRAPEEAIYEPPYEPIASARGAAGAGGPRIEIWSVDAGEDVAADDRRRAEGEAIASWIASRRGTADATGRPLDYKDVAILLRSLTVAGHYVQALRRLDVPFVVEGGREFYERPEVGDLIAFLRAAANPNDAAAVLAVLRSPLGGAPDEELARFAAEGGRLDRPDPAQADAARHPNVRRTLDLLKAFRDGMRGRPPDDVVRAALTETPLEILHASAYEGAQRAANLRKIVGRAEDLARRGLSLEETLRHIEEEFRGETAEGESPLADETVDAVRILSVHKAKGLQYPVVFVPDLGRESRYHDLPATKAVWTGRAPGGHLAVKLESGVTNLAWAWHAAATRRHEEAEEKRVFYVACTRAEERLILVNSSAERKAPWRDALSALGYEVDGGLPPDATLHGGAVEHRRVEPPRVEPAPAPREMSPIWAEAAARFEEVAAAARATATPPMRWASGARDERLASDVVPDAEEGPGGLRGGGEVKRARGPSRDVARRAGTLVHAALEKWDFKDARRLRDLAGREARRAGENGEVEAEATAILDAFLSSGLPARLSAMAAAGRILGREVPVLHRDDAGTTWLGACDLVYRGEDGAIVVADYKTDRVEGRPEAAAEVYRDQLATYAAALRGALPGARVRTEILFVRAGASVPMDPEPKR